MNRVKLLLLIVAGTLIVLGTLTWSLKRFCCIQLLRSVFDECFMDNVRLRLQYRGQLVIVAIHRGRAIFCTIRPRPAWPAYAFSSASTAIWILITRALSITLRAPPIDSETCESVTVGPDVTRSGLSWLRVALALIGCNTFAIIARVDTDGCAPAGRCLRITWTTDATSHFLDDSLDAAVDLLLDFWLCAMEQAMARLSVLYRVFNRNSDPEDVLGCICERVG